MDKKIILILLISLSIFIVGCGNKQVIQPAADSGTVENENTNSIRSESNSKSLNEKTYQLTEKVYVNKNVTVNYPQITNLGDKDKQKVINELIKEEALLEFDKNIDENLDLKIDYVIKLESADILSIQYSGEGYLEGTAHPNNWFYTTNIDINSEEKIKLTDLIKINEKFIENFKKGKYIDYEIADSESSEEKQLGVAEYVGNMDINDLIKYFNQADSRDIQENPSNTFSYLTKDSIVISINVPHPIGDHAEYQINYGDIQSNKNSENKLWEKLINHL